MRELNNVFPILIKEDYLWINDFESLKNTSRKILSWIDYYKSEYLHPAIGYKSLPETRVEREIMSEILTQNSEICV